MKQLKAKAVALLKALGADTVTDEQVQTLLALAARIVRGKFEWDLRPVSEGGDIEVDDEA